MPPPTILTIVFNFSYASEQLAAAEETIVLNNNFTIIKTVLQPTIGMTGMFPEISSSTFHSKKSALTAAIFWLHQHYNWSLAFAISDCKLLIQVLTNSNTNDLPFILIQSLLAAFRTPKLMQLI